MPYQREFRFKVREPFSLELIRCGYFFPYFEGRPHSLVRGLQVGESIVGVEVSQDEDELVVRITAPDDTPESRVRESAEVVARCFGYDEELSRFYSEWESDEKVGRFIEEVRGYRVPSAPDPYEVLVSAVISQNIRAEKFRVLLSRLCKTLGNSWQGFYSFPRYETIARSSVVLRKLGFGYRAELVARVADWVSKSARSLDLSLSTDELFSRLLSVKGIGAYTAGSFLIYGLRRYDAPLYDGLIRRRIMGELLGVSVRDFSEYDEVTREMWGRWRGLVMAHLVVYYRLKSGLGRLV